MQSNPQPIPFPQKGLVVNTSYGAQPPGTTRSASNVRSYDPRGGRDRGAQRSGLTKYAPTQINLVRSSTLVSATSTTAVLDAGASAANSFYSTGNQTLIITGGTGSGQARAITAYVGATKTATVAAWDVIPDATSTYQVTYPIQDIEHLVYTGVTTALSPRQIRGMAIAGGTLKRFTSSAVSAVTNGASAFSAAATVIFGSQLFQKMYFADGVNFKYYDGLTDSVLTLTASAGSLPTDSGGNAPRLLCVWRNRLCWSGLPLDPYNWFMSAKDDGSNYAYSPSPTLETQAVAGNNNTAGQSSDVITALIPYNDEVLIFGQDSTIYQMTGDPMSGGRIDLVTDGVGVAWGRPYCRDGMGYLYLMSSRGSIYKFVPGGEPERISDPIAELLMFDISKTIARMAWDERQFGFHVFLTPTTVGATNHYFYDVRNGSWWQDTHAAAYHNPLSCHVYDGDVSGDRAVLVGSFDSYIRKFDQAALDDDGTAINSSVLCGPVGDSSGATMIDLQISLEGTQQGANAVVYYGRDAQSATQVGAVAALNPGRNRSVAVRAFGHAHYVKLLSLNVPGSAWALEYMMGQFLMGGDSERKW